ncbi:uncharacterized protein JCM15063_002082 [Sporobolomyces koalae]|uniref:uncharacterized protein n=1 Tax=Sporobolomyces koalae TaxID=500713 RepID=UPI00316EA1BA
MSPPRASPVAFLEHLIKLVELEQLAEEQESHLLLTSTPLSVLQRSGLALNNLTAATNSGGLGGRRSVELVRSSAWHQDPKFPPHDLRVGDLARIRNSASSSSTAATSKKGKKVASGTSNAKGSASPDDDGIDAVVYKVGNEKITLVLNDSNHKSSSEDDEEISLKVANPSTFTRQIHFLRQTIRGLEALEGHTSKATTPVSDATAADNAVSEATNAVSSSPPPVQSPLYSVLLGVASPTLDQTNDALKKDNIKYFDSRLNESQKEAIEFALRSNEVAAIWGPPGTGKTQTLVELVRQLVLVQGLRVLVCGASNLSVDNILLRLSTSSSSDTPIPVIPLTRLGHPARILSSLTHHTLDSQSAQTDATALIQDIKVDLSNLEQELNSRDRKIRPKGSQRKEKWDQVRDLRREMRRRFAGIGNEVLGGKRLVLATTHGAGGKVLDKFDQFDVVIIDEAAQATEPACWIPITRGKKLILAGDHLQLPPTLKSLDSSSLSHKSASSFATAPRGQGQLELSKTLETTLFSRLLALHGPEIRRMLKVQYRFNRKINEFPSLMLYERQLVPDSSVEHRQLEDLLSEADDQPDGEPDHEDLNEPVVFFDTAGLAMYERSGDEDSGGGGKSVAGKGQYGSQSKSNENEAEIVLNYVKFLVESGIPPKSISLISPYNSQVMLLSTTISPLYPEIEIGSIDSNQGRENDVVIISLVRSNESGEIGFLKEMRRLNVAMTRPRRQLVVVGDSETLKKGGQEPSNHKNRTNSIKDEFDSLEGEDEEEENVEPSTTADEDRNDQEERKKGVVTGSRFVKEWIEWMEANAYVRVP